MSHSVDINVTDSSNISQSSSSFIELKMASLKLSFLTISCLIFVLFQCEEVHSQIASNDFGLKNWIGKIVGKTVNNTAKALQDPVTRALCKLKTVNETVNVSVRIEFVFIESRTLGF